eukprot:gene2601-3561_t
MISKKRQENSSSETFFKIRNFSKCIEEIEKQQQKIKENSLEFVSLENNKLICKLKLETTVSFQNLIEQIYNIIQVEEIADQKSFYTFSCLIMNESLMNFQKQGILKQQDEYNYSRLIDLIFEKLLFVENFNFYKTQIFQQKEENPNKKSKIEFSLSKKMKYLKQEILSFLQKTQNFETKNSMKILCVMISKIMNIFGLNFIKKEEYQEAITLLESDLQLEEISDESKHSKGINNLLLAIAHKLMSNDIHLDYIYRSIDYIPNSSLILFICGSFLYDKNQLDESKSKFNQILKMNDFLMNESFNMIGCIYVKQNNFEEALNFFNKSLHFGNQTNIIGTYNISSQFEHLGDDFSQQKILELLHKILRKNQLEELPKFEKELFSQIDVSFSKDEILYQIANLSLRQKNFQFSISAYKYLLDRIMESENVTTLHQGKLINSPIRIYREYIEALLNSHEYEKALELTNQILITYPDDNIVKFHQVDALLCLENIDKASSSLNDTIKILEKQNDEYLLSIAYNNMSIISICQNNIDEAIEYLEKANEFPYHNLQIIFNLTLLFIQKRKYVEACILWMNFRNINMDKEIDYYIKIHEELSQDDRLMIEEPIQSHVPGKISQQQQLWMDLEIILIKIDLKDTDIFVVSERILKNQ